MKACTITSALAAMVVWWRRGGVLNMGESVKCSELRNDDPADRTATRAYTAVLWMAIRMSFGLFAATLLIFPELVQPIPVLEYFTFSRARPVHTNLVMFAWLSGAYFGALYYMVPRLAETQLYSSAPSRLLAPCHRRCDGPDRRVPLHLYHLQVGRRVMGAGATTSSGTLLKVDVKNLSGVTDMFSLAVIGLPDVWPTSSGTRSPSPRRGAGNCPAVDAYGISHGNI